jgi:1-phosphofructokinase
VTSEFAGKGVNVTKALWVGGVGSLAVVPVSSLDVPGLSGETSLVPSLVEKPVRVSITVLEDTGQTTKINDSPPPLSAAEWSSLADTAVKTCVTEEPVWFLLAGTMPTLSDGTALHLEALFAQIASTGTHLALDTSGDALRHLSALGLPDVIKPNAVELAECVGRSIVTFGDALDAAHEVVRGGVGTVLVSLGPDGMLGIRATTTVHAWTDPVVVRNTIGAGDASVAGFLAHAVAHPDDLIGAVKNAVAWGAHKVQQWGSQLKDLNDLPPVHHTTSPEVTRTLAEPGILP